MYLADAVKRDPDVERARISGSPQHIAPVLADRQRHTGGGQRLEHGPAAPGRAALIEQREQPRRVRMGGHLMHRIGIKCQASAVAEPMRLLQYPLDVRQRHRPVPHALGPAMPAHRRTARNLHVHRQQRHRTQIARPATGRHSFAHPRIIDQPARDPTPNFCRSRLTAGPGLTGDKAPGPTHAAATGQSAAAPRPANVSSHRASKMKGPGSASPLLQERGQQEWWIVIRAPDQGRRAGQRDLAAE
jgi:hypothetical protein